MLAVKGIGCRVRIGGSVVWLAVAFLLSLFTEYGREQGGAVVLMLLASGIHEMGHWFMARLCGIPLTELRLDLLGARLQTGGGMSYKQEWWLCLGGPLFNFISILSVVPLWMMARLAGLGTLVDEPISSFVALSCGLGGLNLLPIETFDGGRMLYCTLALLSDEDRAGRICRRVSLCMLCLLWMMSVYVLLRVGRSLSVLVFSCMLLYRGLMGECST